VGCWGRPARGGKPRQPDEGSGSFLFLFMYYVYILQSEVTLEFYKGQSQDVFKRLERHNTATEKATCHGVPWRLIWYCQKETRSEAMILEKKIKNLSRAKILKFIEKYKQNPAEHVLTFPPDGKSGC
jgi:putative endonuclease